MGLKINRSNKSLFARPIHTVLKDVGVVIGDLNAMLRSETSGYGSDMTPRKAIDIFVSRHVKQYPNLRFAGFFTDDAKLIPTERQDYLKNVRYAKPPKFQCADEDIEYIDADCLPCDWNSLYNNRKAKSKLFDIMCDLLKKKLANLDRPVDYMVDDPNSVVHASDTAPMSEHNHNFGEADLKVTEAALKLAKRWPDSKIVIKTIDWDCVLTGICLFPPNIWVQFKNVYKRTNGEITATLKMITDSKGNKVKEKAEKVPELVHPNSIRGSCPFSKVFILMVGSKLDYSNGLSRFGFTESKVMKLVTGPNAYTFIRYEVVSGRRVVTFLINDFIQTLRMIERYRTIRSDCIEDFINELNNLWFCLLYYLGIDSKRERGGPKTSIDKDIFGKDVKTVTDILDQSYATENKLVYEENFI